MLFPDPIPSIPKTGWAAPRSFPDLESAPFISFDTETFDPNLGTHGPGWGRGDGHIVGISVAVPGHSWYFPMRHDVGGGNLDPGNVLKWAARELGRGNQPKIGANLTYDIGWLAEEGVEVRGELIDVQFAAPLLDEHRASYSLESIAQHYLGEGKVDEALYDWLYRAYGGEQGRWQAGNIYRSPVALAGPYAEADAWLPMLIWEKQRPLLEEQGLMPLFRLECDLIPILVAMRKRGCPINEEALEPTIIEMNARRDTAFKRLRSVAGFNIDPGKKDHLIRAFENLGLSYKKTAKGNPSFTRPFLENHPHEIGQCIREIRKWDKFIEYAVSYRDKFAVNGIIHGAYHPLRGEKGGTIVGRFSSSTPNLTNIPARDPEAKKLLRGLFKPWDGERWRSRDYSQIQFRIMVHYAMGPGAEEARQRYVDKPDTDYHDMALDMVAPVAGWDISTSEKHASWRKPVKNINFALAFTGGVPTLMRQLGKPRREVEVLLEQYHSALPFLKYTSNRMDAVAQERGWIKGILGRRHRFPLWEPKCWALRDYVQAHPEAEEVDRRVKELVLAPPPGLNGRRLFTGVQRADTRLGLNRVSQDGEGSTIKAAMVACWKAGIYDIVGVPLNTVHDEINHSDPGTKEAEEAFAEMMRIMQTVVKWKVPLLVGDEVGPNWAELTAL